MNRDAKPAVLHIALNPVTGPWSVMKQLAKAQSASGLYKAVAVGVITDKWWPTHVLRELQAQDIEAHVATVGCIGMCSAEPLVDIEQAGKPRITYQNITSDKVSHLITEHLKNGGIVDEWVFARLSKDR